MRDILPVVVAGLVSRQRQQADQRDRARRGENGQRASARPPCRPAAIPRTLIFRLGSNSPNRLPTAITAGTSVSATATATIMPTAQGMPRVWKYGIRAKLRQNVAPAIVKPEAKDNVGDPAIHGVEGRFPVLAGLACLLIAADEENPVVGSGRDPDRHQQVNGEGGKPDQAGAGRGTRRFPGPPANSMPTMSNKRITVMIER